MKSVVTFPGGGKTYKAIKWAADHDAYIVVFGMVEAKRVADEAKRRKLKIPFPITFDELLEGHKVMGTQRSLVFDNVDMLLRHLANGRKVVGFTATASAE